ncbi:MAG: ABC transporter ATP-binding protein [Acidobacteriota bacterium]
MTPPLLEAEHLRFGYQMRAREPRAANFVIDDVSFTVRRGAILGILGPNGSGKTTLLKLITGALRPTSGDARLDGVSLGRVSRREVARQVAVVAQETNLAFDYTTLEIVLMGRYPRLGAFEVEGPDDLAAAFAALEATNTRSFASRAFPTLSGGEKQRVVIAAALAQLDTRPRTGGQAPTAASSANERSGAPLLILDEPTAALDLRYQLEVSALIQRLNRQQGITVVLSTHDLRLAQRVCSEVMLLSTGRVLAHGLPGAVLTPELVGELYSVDAAEVAPLLARA